MSGKLPQRIDPFRAAEQGRVLKGEIPVRQLTRLLDVVAEPGQDLPVEFRFVKDDGGQSFVEVACHAVLVLRCERCLGNVDFTLDLHHRLALIDEQSEKAQNGVDAVAVDDEGLFLREMLEDEILLSLPLIPRHASLDACDQDKIAWIKSPENSESPERAANPFEILKKLKD